MKHVKARAVTELTELRKKNKELQDKVAGMEEEMGRIRESLSHTSMKLGPPASVNGSTSSISSRGRGPQQPRVSSPTGKTPSLSQVQIQTYSPGYVQLSQLNYLSCRT